MTLLLSHKVTILLNFIALWATLVLGFSFPPSAVPRPHFSTTTKHWTTVLSFTHQEHGSHRVFTTQNESMHSGVLLAALVASSITMQPTMAQAYPVLSTTTAPTVFSSLQLATLANPIGELQDGIETGINPTFSSFGQWFFLTYIVVSLLAGGKEVLRRIQNQRDEQERK